MSENSIIGLEATLMTRNTVLFVNFVTYNIFIYLFICFFVFFVSVCCVLPLWGINVLIYDMCA